MDNDVQTKPIYRRIQSGDTDPILDLAKNCLNYVDLATAEIDPNDYYSLRVMSGLSYSDLDATDPASNTSMSVVAEIDNKVIGFLLAYNLSIGIPVTKICMIQAIVVDPNYHGQGIGTQLLSHLRNRCYEKDIKIIRMLVHSHNAQLSNYIRSLGFQPSYIVNYDISC